MGDSNFSAPHPGGHPDAGLEIDRAKQTTDSRTNSDGARPRVRFKEPEEKHPSALIHPTFRQHPGSGQAGEMLPVDHWIAAHGGTTSTNEELPHRLRKSKQHRPLTNEERIKELTYSNGYLREELAYYKTVRNASSEFYSKVVELHSQLKEAMDERSGIESHAESKLLQYWGIDPKDLSLEGGFF